MADVTLQQDLDELEEILAKHTGEEAVVYSEDGGIQFYNEDPAPKFSGFSNAPIFETTLLLSENDDAKVRRIERLGDWVISVDIDGFRVNGGCCYVAGSMVRCAPGSAQEKEFVQTALENILLEAAEPLMVSLQRARAGGLTLNDSLRQKLMTTLFG